MEYYLGLDMGTNSVGWAVTDPQYRLMRAKGKDLWGARLFQDAKTSATRRTFRTNRRRKQRERARIGFLQECFSDEINAKDAGFFQRLEDSKFFEEDKTEKQPYALFADTGYTDVEYFKDYPTIFHLRKELIQSSEEHDVRLVYLAVLNIFKHRGHFLNQNLSDSGLPDLERIYTELVQNYAESLSLDFSEMSDLDYSAIKDLLSTKKLSNSRRAEELTKQFGINKKSASGEMIKAMCGLSATVVKMFPNETIEEESDVYKMKFSFRDSDLEGKLAQLESALSDEAYECLILIKQIHDWGLLASIMTGNGKNYTYLSEARVDQYNKHHRDLILLKKVVRKYSPDKYNEVFRIMKDNNYSAYIGHVNSRIEKTRRGGTKRQEDFYKTINSLLPNNTEDPDVRQIKDEMERGTFLPKLLTNSNGVIPMQLNKIELSAILHNAENYLSFLKKKDENGLTVSEKIVKMFSFQIPYYVGPLLNTENNNAWVVRKEGGKVYPWNFEQKIDVKKSSEEFIARMVKHCTYLGEETVLPKASLLYEKFMVLNELNNLRINGEKIAPELKQELYKALFLKGKKVKAKQVVEYLQSRGLVEKEREVELTGIDGDFVNTLSSNAKFCAIFGVDQLSAEQEKMAEQIIYWSTIYNDSKKFLQEKIQESYGDILSTSQIKRITGIRFREWGRLSREMVELEGADKENGEIKTIIHRMWDENVNLMELLSNRFTYTQAIENRTRLIDKTLNEIEYEDLDGMYLSAPVRRMIWQTILIMKELYFVLKKAPAKIFVEMAREGNAEKVRKQSRKKKFAELYKNIKDEEINWKELIDSTDEGKFSSKKFYLYLTQCGRCMYTGERIELEDLFKDNLYDIDHIYPRHFVKDDSIENNLVLVKKEKNSHKSDVFPLERSIRSQQASFWKTLCDHKLITKEKYNRLMRTESFSEGEMAQFINRQLVETRQGTKMIAKLMQRTFPDSKIVYAKAENVSLFRQKYNLIKCRRVNDFHHAQDAYLNIVVGNTYSVKFTDDPRRFIQEFKKDPNHNKYHMYKLFDYDVVRGVEKAWIAENGESIGIVRNMMAKNTPLVTQYSYKAHGGFADQTVYSAKKAGAAKDGAYMPLKSKDPRLCDVAKYGGVTKISGSYFFLVEYTEKKKRIRSIEAVPIYLAEELNSTGALKEYAEKTLGYTDPDVRIPCIKINSLLEVNGFFATLTGRTGDRLILPSATQLKMDKSSVDYIRLLENNAGEKDDSRLQYKKVSREANEILYGLFIEKHLYGIYSRKPNAIGQKLKDKESVFKNLTIGEQVEVLLQILQISCRVNTGADLKLLKESSSTGITLISKHISNQQSIFMINQSVTGLYQKKIDLLKI